MNIIAKIQDTLSNLSTVDIAVFIGFIAIVLFVGIFMGRKREEGTEESSESYFLAGRGLTWWLIGFSLIAANISAEQFVSMSGSAARPVGLAIAGYEWLAAVSLVVVAFFFLPIFLRCGIYTIPEFLERRFGPTSRLLMSLAMVIILIGVNFTAVVCAGAKFLEIYIGKDLNLTTACWVIGVVSAIYVLFGGLKACAWADLLQGSALIIGGAVILFLAVSAFDKTDVAKIAPTPEVAQQLEGKPIVEKFRTINAERLHTIRPKTCDSVPWTALLIGLWIPNLYYWGLNQYIMQRTLGARSLAHGQGGIVFAACLKLLIPFLVIIPGMIALNLFKDGSLGYDKNNMRVEAKTKSNLYPAAVYAEKTGDALPSYKTGDMDEIELKAYNKDLATAQKAKVAEKPVMFKFNDDFAAMYPDDVAAIIAYNTELYRGLVGEGVDIDAKIEEQYQKEVKKEQETATENKRWDIGSGGVGENQHPRLRNQAVLDLIESDYNENITGSGFKKMAYSIRSIPSMISGAESGLVEVQKEFVGYDYDAAFPLLCLNLARPIKWGLSGFVLAAMMGAVMSTVASILNAASTIFTMDLVKRYLNTGASEKALVWYGRILVVIFMLIGSYIAPMLTDPRFGGLFAFIQEFQGFISPGILAIFIFGLFVRRAPSACGIVGMLVGPAVYGLLMFTLPHWAFLNRMALTFGIVVVLLLLLRLFFPRKEPYLFEQKTVMEMKSSRIAQVVGVLVVLTVAALYWVLR